MTPSISVVIPLHNGAPYVGQAVESVRGQSYRPHELIVVDDGSTDGGAEGLTGDSLTVVRQARQGPAAARNRGAALASGRLLAFLDADDLWHSDKLRAYVDHLARYPAPMAIGHFEYRLEPGCPPPRGLRPASLTAPQVGPIPSALVVDRAIFFELGGFDERFPTAEDVEWLGRVRSRGLAMTVVPGVYLYKRVHRSNLSLTASTRRKDLFRALHATDRRLREG